MKLELKTIALLALMYFKGRYIIYPSSKSVPFTLEDYKKITKKLE